jgi:transposase
VHFSIQSTIARTWAAKGSKPRVKSYAGKKNASYSGFVTPSDGRLFVAKPLWFNWETTIESFRQFISQCDPGEGKRIVLILDNAPWHKKAKRLVETEPEYQDIRDRMTFVSLPPYSPDLNPIEQVWRITRREKTHNHFWPDFTSLSATLDSWFASLSIPNEKLRTLCSFKTNGINQ